jgi:hypothetical protein
MKLVGGDSGRCEREEFVEEVLLSPSERAVVDVLFDAPGEVRLEHRTPGSRLRPRRVLVSGTATGDAAAIVRGAALRPRAHAERRSIEHDFERAPDKMLSFVASMPLLYGERSSRLPPTSAPCTQRLRLPEQGTCPKCGMRLVPVQAEVLAPSSYACPMHPEVTASEPTRAPSAG